MVKILREGREVTVRLHGIDCPEKGQAGARERTSYKHGQHPDLRGVLAVIGQQFVRARA
jgi:hypothetical protein